MCCCCMLLLQLVQLDIAAKESIRYLLIILVKLQLLADVVLFFLPYKKKVSLDDIF